MDEEASADVGPVIGRNAEWPRFVSADSHLVEPPHIWDRWLPAKFQDDAPRLVVNRDGTRSWHFDSGYGSLPIDTLSCLNHETDFLDARGIRAEDIVRGARDGRYRHVAQACDGVSAEVIFPNGATMGHFLDQPDERVVAAGVRAYNNFVRFDYCAEDPTRLFPVAQMPSTGVSDCLAELKYAISEGFHAAVLPCWPSGKDHLTDGDLPFFQLAEEAGIPVCLHVRFRSREERLVLWELRRLHPVESRPDLPPRSLRRAFANPGESLGQAATVLSELLTSGLFALCPGLRFGLIETWAGWIPRVLESLDDMFLRAHDLENRTPDPPSVYWRQNMAASFLDDRPAMILRDLIGVPNLMWSSDFPHACTHWPRSRDVAMASMVGMPTGDVELISAGNAARFFHMEPRHAVDL